MTGASAWSEALSAALREAAAPITRIVVLEETRSTQDECRRLAGDRPGCLVTALRQTAGRGRLGRRWADDRGEGVALTLSVAPQPPERLALAAGVAVCEAAERLAGRPLTIRWPNDVMADDHKLAGILIEQLDHVAFVGVGINVNQNTWPSELADAAISLRQLTGAAFDRIRVTAEVAAGLTSTLDRSDADLAAAFAPRDLLTGTTRTFLLGGERITGVVERVDPLAGLRVRTPDGRRTLPAALTSLAH